MTLRHMKIFVTVFQHNNITQAARELHLAQPSVSLAVKELEQYYGIRLFDRIGRRICPTECGKEFYSYALHLVSLFEEMEKKIRNWDAIGPLRVGASITIGTHILPSLVRQYQTQVPSRSIEAVVARSSEIEQKILRNSIDIGLIETTPESADIRFIPFLQDEMCAIVPCGHPLAGQPSVPLARLADFPFLMREKGSAGRELLEARFALEHLTVRPAWESVSTQAIVRAVSEGLGVAVLPRLLIERDVRENIVTALPLQEPLRRELNIIYHKSKYLTPNMKEFIDLCRPPRRPHSPSTRQSAD